MRKDSSSDDDDQTDDQSYEDYIDEVEHMRSREREPDVRKILSHLGLPDYEYVDAQNYDHLLPSHLTYGKDQTVKLHNAKLMSREDLDIVSSFLSVFVCRNIFRDNKL